MWRICHEMGWWSVFGKPKRHKGSKAGTAAHDDLVRRNFTATAPNQVWVADLADRGLFGPRGSQGFAKSADWRSEADRILTHLRVPEGG